MFQPNLRLPQKVTQVQLPTLSPTSPRTATCWKGALAFLRSSSSLFRLGLLMSIAFTSSIQFHLLCRIEVTKVKKHSVNCSFVFSLSAWWTVNNIGSLGYMAVTCRSLRALKNACRNSEVQYSFSLKLVTWPPTSTLTFFNDTFRYRHWCISVSISSGSVKTVEPHLRSFSKFVSPWHFSFFFAICRFCTILRVVKTVCAKATSCRFSV